MRRSGLALALFLSTLIWSPSLLAGDMIASAVVFMYHRFGETDYPSTNVRMDQFEAHLAEISTGGYKVMPLRDIISAFRRQESLPDRAIALTIDDAFLSLHNRAWPLLKKAGLPFTLFVATDAIDARRPGYMSWSQLRALVAAGVGIGSQTGSHPHLPEVDQARLDEEFSRSNARFRAELGFAPELLAYPFGEFGAREKEAARAAGFVAAFGQHSGVAHNGDDLFALPRFALNEKFGGVERFRLAGNGLPLPVSDVLPVDTVIRGNNPPDFGFTVVEGIGALDNLACFASNQPNAAQLERLGKRRFEVRLDKPFAVGRSRINCTLRAAGNRWRWFGMQFYVPKR
ncbi:MAG: polysaccharide deacetylase family protein [Rhodospirillaceae bacterium]|nr:polysaccharide deacetylase family protein [Rhodospirillaceae bacterium]MBT4489073.1 polysaccharide deacetylase family protein [Rhodospirillaceae bacterium]MBT5193543.1 polysaccharide deacetylase family protein [Rhodospirillaceae bacterium]MBT5896910.1 polysaccharide deacetylase family protein [Rhodospirillaceae bacterium]MBT7759823.1 polysaccharide deacetylase family protein [Rhodospirillaceae bacterium]